MGERTSTAFRSRDDRTTVAASVQVSRRRRWLTIGAWLAGVAGAFAVYLCLAGTRAVNSDGASEALQAWDLLHGNVLLRGWMMTDVSFYTTEIPEYMLVELARGLNAQVVHIAAAATYTLAVLLAALLAKGRATGRVAALRVALAAGIMLAPQLNAGTDVLLSSPDHIGTSVPVMLTWLLLDRVRPRWWVPVATSVLLAWSMIGDELVLVVGILPLIVVCAVRVAQVVAGSGWRALRRQWHEVALGAGAAAAGVVGIKAPELIHALGGFYVRPVGARMAPLGLITGHNLGVAGNGFLLLAGAYFPGLPPGVSTWAGILHVVGLALAACAIGVTAWRFFRGEELVPQLLLAGVAINVASYVLGMHAATVANAREMAPVLPFAAALAGRQLSRYLTGRGLPGRVALSALGIVLLGYAGGLAYELTAPQAPPQAAELSAWLETHPIGVGLSGYWESNVVTLTSGQRVAVRYIGVTHGRIAWHGMISVKRGWYDPATSRANFVVIGPAIDNYPGFTNERAVIDTFGKPARVYHAGWYTILWWPRNLLASVRSSPFTR